MAAYLDTLTWAIIRFGLIQFAAFICICLLIIHSTQCIRNRKKKKALQSNRQQQSKMALQRKISIMTFIMIFLFAISPISIMISENLIFLKISAAKSRLVFVQIAVCFFRAGKCIMYLIFVLKLHLLYGGTTYEYKPLILRIFALLIILSTIIWIIFLPGAPKMEYTPYDIPWSDSKYDTIYKYHTYFSRLLIICAGINELISWSVLIYAFMRPLRKLMKSVVVDDESSKEFKFLATKATILTLSSVISSIFSYIFVAVWNVSIITNCFDMPFNCICIMLMNPYYETLYKRLCCGIISCVKCCNGENKKNHIDNLDINISKEAVISETESPQTPGKSRTQTIDSVAPSNATELTVTNV